MVFIEALLHESHSLCMTVQTCRVQVPTVVNAGGPSADTNDSIIQNTIGTPPQPRDKALADLSVGSPGNIFFITNFIFFLDMLSFVY